MFNGKVQTTSKFTCTNNDSGKCIIISAIESVRLACAELYYFRVIARNQAYYRKIVATETLSQSKSRSYFRKEMILLHGFTKRLVLKVYGSRLSRNGRFRRVVMWGRRERGLIR